MSYSVKEWSLVSSNSAAVTPNSTFARSADGSVNAGSSVTVGDESYIFSLQDKSIPAGDQPYSWTNIGNKTCRGFRVPASPAPYTVNLYCALGMGTYVFVIHDDRGNILQPTETISALNDSSNSAALAWSPVIPALGQAPFHYVTNAGCGSKCTTNSILNTTSLAVFTISILSGYDGPIHFINPLQTEWPSFQAIIGFNSVQVVSINITSSPSVFLSLLGSTSAASAVALPSNAPDQELLWQSSALEVASVDTKGIILARGVGIAKVVATSRNGVVSHPITVNVNPAYAPAHAPAHAAYAPAYAPANLIPRVSKKHSLSRYAIIGITAGSAILLVFAVLIAVKIVKKK